MHIPNRKFQKGLTVCLAVFNEIENIKHAIESTVDIADEIVVVDGGSKDGTVEWLLNRSPKIHVIHLQNDPMFHRLKQKAIENAAFEWILQLDADEKVTLELQHEIQKIVRGRGDAQVYSVPRLNYFLGRFLRKGGVYPDYTIRLYKAGLMYFPCKDLHENVEFINKKNFVSEKTLGKTTNPLEHYSDPTWSRYMKRWYRYTDSEARRLFDQREKYKKFLWLSDGLKILVCISIRPLHTFLLTYIRHKGFMDGWQGFVFHFMSALRWIRVGIVYFRLCIA